MADINPTINNYFEHQWSKSINLKTQIAKNYDHMLSTKKAHFIIFSGGFLFFFSCTAQLARSIWLPKYHLVVPLTIFLM